MCRSGPACVADASSAHVAKPRVARSIIARFVAQPRTRRVCYETPGEKLEKAMFGNFGHRFLLFPSDLDSSAQLASQGLLKLDCAENIQHAFQVVDHTSQTDLRLRASHPAEQETRVSEYAVLQRGERMFDGGSS
jgi:hypothetical protein